MRERGESKVGGAMEENKMMEEGKRDERMRGREP